MTSSRTRQASATLVALAALVTAILTVASSATANPSITSKEAQARAILAEIDQKNMALEQTIEAYNYANVQLAEIDGALKTNTRHLAVARQSLNVAQAHIAERLRALYVNGDGGGAVEVILGAESLDDLLNRLDMVQRVGDQDNQVLKDVKSFRREVQHRRAKLRSDRQRQERVVASRAAQKASVESQLGELRRLESSVQDELQRMRAEEARRQQILAAQARARLLQEQQAAAAAAAARLTASDAATSTGQDAAAPVLEATTSEGTTSAPPARYGGVVGIAMQYLGVPYVWGGASPSGFDCSGLVQFVFNQVGVSLPHHAASIFNYGTPVSESELQPGDLVFFSGLGHMGIYIGGGQMIHAPHTGDVVKISSIYRSGYVGARRL